MIDAGARAGGSMNLDSALRGRPLVSRHATPQVGPQEWDCGCITDVRVSSDDTLPFEMRLAIACGKIDCEVPRCST